MSIVVPENQEQNLALAQWACDILGDELEAFGFDRHGYPLFSTIGFAVDNELLCVFVAFQYAKPNVTMAFASTSPRWATKGNIAYLGRWLFDSLDCQRITAIIEKKNKRSRKFCEGVGFRHEGKLRKAKPDGDVIIYGLLKEDHEEWLRKAFNGKKYTASAGRRPQRSSTG